MKVKKINMYYLFWIGYMLLMSGSFFAHTYSDILTKINMVVTCFVLIVSVKNYKKYIRQDIVTLFFVVVLINYGIRIFYWSEFASLTGYLGDILIVAMYIFLGTKMQYKIFSSLYIKIMRIMSIASLFGHVFYSYLIKLPVPIIGTSWKYHWFGIFALREVGGSVRNSGFFWEPGMYQGFLIFGILIILMKKQIERKDKADIILIAITVVTTASTTGYFLLFLLLMEIILIRINPHDTYKKSNNVRKGVQWGIIIVSIIVALVAFTNSQILHSILSVFPENVVGKLLDPQNISTNSRAYGMLYDLILSIKYPFGVGRDSMKSLWNMMMNQYGVEVIGRTSAWTTAFVYSGFLGGICYVYMWLRACYMYQKGNLIRILYCILIMAIILNTEPHYATLFFNAVAVMWIRDFRSVHRERKELHE